MYMSWCQHVYFGGAQVVCRKTPFWGGCQKWSFLGGVPKRVISDPPGGVGLGGGFRPPPWTVVAGLCFGAIFAPPRRGAKTGILTSPVSRSPSGHTMGCKKVFMYVRDVCSSS